MHTGQRVTFTVDYQGYLKGQKVGVYGVDHYGFVNRSFPRTVVTYDKYPYKIGQKVRVLYNYAKFKVGDIGKITGMYHDLIYVDGLGMYDFRIEPHFEVGQKVKLNCDYGEHPKGTRMKVLNNSYGDEGTIVYTNLTNCYAWRLVPHATTRGVQKRFYWRKGEVAGCTDNPHSYVVFNDAGYQRISRKDFRNHVGKYTEVNHPSNIVDDALGRSYGH